MTRPNPKPAAKPAARPAAKPAAKAAAAAAQQQAAAALQGIVQQQAPLPLAQQGPPAQNQQAPLPQQAPQQALQQAPPAQQAPLPQQAPPAQQAQQDLLQAQQATLLLLAQQVQQLLAQQQAMPPLAQQAMPHQQHPVQYVVDTEQTREAKLQITRNTREIGAHGTAVPGVLTMAWLQRHNINALSQVRSTVAETPGHPSFQTVYQLWTGDKTSRQWTTFFLQNPQGYLMGVDVSITLAREYLQLVCALCEWTRIIEGGHAALEAPFSFDGWYSAVGGQAEDFETTSVKDMKKWHSGACTLTRHLVRPSTLAVVMPAPALAAAPVVAAPVLLPGLGAIPGAPVGRGGVAPRGGDPRGRGGRGGGPHPLWPLHVATHLIAARARPAVTVPPAVVPPGCCYVCHGPDHFANAPCPN